MHKTLATNNELDGLNDGTIVSYYEELRKKREATWFTTFVANTDEKIKISSILKELISMSFKGNNECNVLDVGCGEGFLSEKIAKSMKMTCKSIKYSAIDKDPGLVLETVSKLSYVGIDTNDISVGDCYGDGLSAFARNPVLLIASHVAYWAPNIKEFIEKIIEKMGNDTIAVFIHQSPYSLVSQMRSRYGLELKTNSPNEIAKILSEKGISFTELLFSSTVSYPKEAAVKVMLDGDKATVNELYYTTKNLTEFLLQSPIEYLDQVGTKEKALEEIDLRLKTQDNKMVLWEVMQIASKRSQKIEEIKDYLINYRDELGFTALHWAIFEKREDIVNYLVKNGCNINADGPFNLNPLELSIIRGDNKITNNLIDHGALIKEESLDLSYLIYAIYTENEPLERFLLLNPSLNSKRKENNVLFMSISGMFDKDDNNKLGKVAEKLNKLFPLTCVVGVRQPLIVTEIEDLMIENELLSKLIIDVDSAKIKDEHTIIDPNGKVIQSPYIRAQKGDTLLHKYMDSNFDIRKVEKLLKKAVYDINSKNDLGRTPLMEASMRAYYKGEFDKIKLLLEYGANPNITDRHLQNSLAYAVMNCDKSSDLSIIKLLLNYSVNVNQERSDGAAPIFFASSQGCFEYAKLLYEHGANTLNLINNSNILHYTNGTRLLEFYLDNGLDIDKITVTEQGNATPLLVALTTFHDEKAAELLIRRGAKLEYHGQPIPALLSAVQQNMNGIVKLVLERGADINAVTKEGATSLHTAVWQKNVPLVKLLLEYGANPNITDPHLQNPLTYAVANCDKSNDLSIIELLLNYSVDVNQENSNGTTPIIFASSSGCFEYAKLLYEHEANTINIYNNGNILHYANGIRLLEFYLDNGLDINNIQLTELGNVTPLLVALTSFHDEKSAELLIKRGAKLDVPGQSLSALAYAVEQKMNGTVKLALKHGADVNALTKTGFSSLHLAVFQENIPLIKCLLAYGADTKLKSIHGTTPRDIAMQSQKLEAAKILQQSENNPELIKGYSCDELTDNYGQDDYSWYKIIAAGTVLLPLIYGFNKCAYYQHEHQD